MSLLIIQKCIGLGFDKMYINDNKRVIYDNKSFVYL